MTNKSQLFLSKAVLKDKVLIVVATLKALQAKEITTLKITKRNSKATIS